MAFTLLLAAGRRLVEGDRYARGPHFLRYDPGYMLGREVHSSTLGIVGLGRIGKQVAKRAHGFDMKVLYHNRRRLETNQEQELGVHYAGFDGAAGPVRLRRADGAADAGDDGPDRRRGARPDEADRHPGQRGPRPGGGSRPRLTEALKARRIYAAALDVTDPEPLPRDHPLLKLDNVTIAPHLGSATEQTRQRMAEVSIANLLAGLQGKPLLHEVKPA